MALQCRQLCPTTMLTLILASATAWCPRVQLRYGGAIWHMQTSRLTRMGESIDDEISLLRARLVESRSREVRRRKPRFLGFSAASSWAQQLGLSTREQWNEWLELGEGRSSYVPSDPETHYGKQGT